MTKEELKAVIRCLHRIYYQGDILHNQDDFLVFHQHLQELFNYAEITDTLVENNPDQCSPEQFEQMTRKQ